MTEAIVRRAALVPVVVLTLGLTGGLAGCGALDVSDPTAIEDGELKDAQGAELLRGAALRALADALADGAYYSGLLADEFLFDMPPGQTPGQSPDDLLDRRESVSFEALGFTDGGYGRWQGARRSTTAALAKLQAYSLTPDRVGEMFALRGYAALHLAEQFCPGFPLHDVVDYEVVYGPPLSTEEVLAKALADFDSAAAYATDSARILHLVQVGRARTLLGLGRFADAATAVDGVPTAYAAKAEFSTSVFPGNSRLVFGQFGDLSRSVADQEGGTGLDFVSANDPRVQRDSVGMATDGVTIIYSIAKYPDAGAPIVLASGIEARLIEAEAALVADPESGEWLAILNSLRTEAVGGVAGLAPLADPGTETARVDLLFRERAFWLFATGHRLADLRRLVQIYGRPAGSVFPTGSYRFGGTYGTATSIPFPDDEAQLSPGVTGCTSR